MVDVDKAGIEELLLEAGLISISQLKKAWDIQRSSNKPMEEVLTDLGLVTPKDIAIFSAKKLDIEYVDLNEYEIQDESVQKLITENIAQRYILIPLERNDDVLTVAMKDPADIFALDDLRLATSLEIKPVLADPELIQEAIKKAYAKPEPVKAFIEPEVEEVEKEEIPEPVEEFVRNELPKAPEINKTAKNVSNSGLSDEDAESKSLIFKDRIGKQMVKSGVITGDQLDAALDIQTRTGARLGEILVQEGFITKRVLYGFLEKQLGIPHIDLDGMEVPEEVVRMVNENISRRYVLVPIEKDDYSLKVAMSDPMNIFSIDDMRLATGLEIIPLLADVEQINEILDKFYSSQAAATGKASSEIRKTAEDFETEIQKVTEEIQVEIQEDEQEEENININDIENAPIVKMVNIILQKAVASRASDIHIEPYEDSLVIRYRIDGQLVETMKHDRKILSALVARIKIMSGLNIAEKRVPQDGRIALKIDEVGFDLRVSVLPTMFGEKIVIRITDKEGFNVQKKQLGFFDDDLEKFDEILAHPHGIVLVTGPTGSGKSTTLYTALRELCKPNVNIMTVEDPVENTIKGINQVQVNVKAGLTFAAALRSFLRQDPDIIMVGEIRDAETAEIAIRAAITGHLVLSTLHTNDAASSITRLIDMGIEPFMVSSSIVGVIAQRLVRKLCPQCKKEVEISEFERNLLKIDIDEDVKIYASQGCPHCNNTGYKGRVAVYEIMTINREIREFISKNVTSDIIKDHALKNGMFTLRENGNRLVKSGVTSVDEILRVTYSKE
ncbi:MAG: ATPase, T2SS/T4P/T4SS family [Clostridia bacterium]|nr:ATPase, T2SS/T4P/T4SS family [Clostridia bacterium]